MRTQSGFSIIELMVVVAVLAILVTVGLPSFRTLVANNRITSQLNAFSSTLALARSEAVKVNQRVVVCPSSDGTGCEPDADWNVGWIAYVDNGDPPLLVQAALTPAAMTFRSNLASNEIGFNGLGATGQAGLFVLCDERGDAYARAIAVAATGRVSVRTTQLDGSALSCEP